MNNLISLSKSIVFIALLSLTSTQTFSQQFQQVYTTASADFLVDAIQSEDDGFYLTGFSNGTNLGGNDAMLIKTTRFGEIIWSKAYGGSESDTFNSILPLESGNMIVAGTTQSASANGSPDAFIAELDPDGEVVWTTVIGGLADDQIRDITVSPSGNFILCGLTTANGESNGYDVFVASVSPSGQMQWIKTYGSPLYEVPLGILVNTNGKIFVWGHQNAQGSGYDAFLMKLDHQGEYDWDRRFALPENELAWDIIATDDGGVMLSGDTGSAGAGLTDVFVMRVNTDGEIQWAKTYGTWSNDHGTNLVHIENDLYAVAGASGGFGQGGLDFFTLWLNDEGDLKHATSYGGEIKDVAHGAIKTNDDGILIVGETRSYGEGFYSALAVKVDQDGRCACNNANSSGIEIANVEFAVGSAGLVLGVEEMESGSSDFLNSTGDIISNEVLCSDAPIESVPNSADGNQMQEANAQRLTLYPNPSNGPVMAMVKTERMVTSLLEVFNMEGKVVYQRTLEGTNGIQQVQLDNLTTGIYLTRLSSEQRVETARLIIE
jgi:hypothetical protein